MECIIIYQFVIVSFSDAINIVNIGTYRQVLYGRRNSNGCNAGATFFVTHENNNYQLVNELHNQGFEIALHSITKSIPQSYWAEATYDIYYKEFAEQIFQMTAFANVSRSAIKGMRIPFLQMGGNASFELALDLDLYDNTWQTNAFTGPGLWPYTLDFASIQECINPPCPTACLPGAWVLPLISWRDLTGSPCTVVDACYSSPDQDDEDSWYGFMLSNFERHYLGNRAPFNIYIQESYVNSFPAIKRAFTRFLDLINNLHDVFQVNSYEVIKWVKNPLPLNEYREKPCQEPFAPIDCTATQCGPLAAEHNGNEYWMKICTDLCPTSYPWYGNPLGA